MMRHFLIASLCVLLLSGFSIMDGGEITEENIHLLDPRNPDNASLPQSDDPLWETLASSTVDVDGQTGRYKIHFPENVQLLNGKKLKISGFMLPLEATETFSHVLLSRQAPTCFFCLPGNPNEIIEVYTEKPIRWSDHLVTVEGTMNITKDEESGMVYVMKNAALIK